jgi:hypothetical protein
VLKQHESVKELESKAATAIRDLVAEVPTIRIDDLRLGSQVSANREIDMLARIQVHGRPHILVCEVKSNGQPRNVRAALLQLRNYVAHLGSEAIPVFISPYLSPEAQALCKENNVAFLDLAGNARLAFDDVFIERRIFGRPPAARRELKSLFKPKSAQVLRVLLRDPKRAWRVTELAKTAGVSLGHISNVRAGLLDREWARISDDGLFLSGPDALLNAWREEYQSEGDRLDLYTTLHGTAFEVAAREILDSLRAKAKVVFSSFSAAHWLAPFGRTGMQYFYADRVGLDQLRERLRLSSSPKGANVAVTVPKDFGIFRDTVEPAQGAVCTSPVQTYLDLWVSGERGQEAAEFLRQEKLSWRT